MFTDWKRLVFGLSMVSYVLFMLSNNRADPDLWGYLAFGRLFWSGEGFPYQDVFAYVPTRTNWIYHEWLTGALFYPIYKSLGGFGLQLLKYILGLLTACLVYLTARKRGASPLLALCVLFCVSHLFVFGYSPVRAQIFTYLFFVLYIYVLEMTKRDQCWSRLWWLVPVQLIWSNLHGGFLTGFGILVLYALGEGLSRRRFWPYAKMSAFCGLVTLINPYGIEYWKYIIKALSMSRSEIWEWHSVLLLIKNGEPMATYLVIFSALLASFIFVIWYRSRDLTDILFLATTAYLGLKHFRHQVFFLLAVGIYMPAIFTAFLDVLKSHGGALKLQRALNGRVPVILIAFLAVYFGYRFVTGSPFEIETPPRRSLEDKSRMYYPNGAIQYIRDHNLVGNVLPDFAWGEFIIWTLYPNCRVAMDGRYETVYHRELSAAYWNFHKGRDGWRSFLHEHPHDMILIRPDSRIHELLQKEPDWREVYLDVGCVLFLKETVRVAD